MRKLIIVCLTIILVQVIAQLIDLQTGTISGEAGTINPLDQASGDFSSPFGKYIENINGVPLELARVPAGSFLMGNDISQNPEEKPAHIVRLKS